jgi:hypothetical protein
MSNYKNILKFENIKFAGTGIAAVLVSALLLFALHTYKKLILVEYLAYYLWFIPPVLIIMFLYRNYVQSNLQEDSIKELLPGIILFIFLLLALVSSHNHFKWFYFLKWRHAPVAGFHYFEAGFIQFIFITQLLIFLFLLPKRKTAAVIGMVFVFIQIICLWKFISVTNGEPLYRDDHPCFIYRIYEFLNTFPRFLNYNPEWNAGTEDCSGVTTGAVSLMFLFWPIWKIFGVFASYTYVYGILFIILMPLLYVLSLRIMGGDWASAWSAGILSIIVSHYYFLWLARYGTPGAAFSSALLVPFSACVYRGIWLNKREWWLFLALILTGFFLVLWPPGIVMGVGVFFALIVNFKRLSKKNILFLLLCFGVFFALYFRIFLIIFSPSSVSETMGSFNCSRDNTSLFSLFNLKVFMEGLCNLRDHIMEGNPILIFFGIGGILFLRNYGVKCLYIPIMVFVMIFTAWGDHISTELQFTRMGVPMFFISVVPAALWISDFLKSKNLKLVIIQPALISLLMLTGWNCVRLYGNEWFVSFETIPQDTKELISWIRTNTSEKGRILLSGATLHAYGGGHANVLPYLTKREMLASDYVLFSTYGDAPDFPPPEFRETKEKMAEYMDRYDITNVIVWDDPWKALYRKYPEQFEEAVVIADKVVFKVKRNANIFFKGKGEVTANFNSIKVTVDNPSEECVIKYNWINGLYATPPSEIYPFDAGYGIKFIGIKPNGKKNIQIQWR